MAQENGDIDYSEYQGTGDVYEHEHTAPLISELLPSSQIAAEYAGADEAFVSKTQQLPQLYPQWRRVRGDGNCGFRCALFGYCEALLRLRDESWIVAECERMRQLSTLVIEHIGDVDYFFDDNVIPLYDDLKAWVSLEFDDARTRLLHRFQDHDQSVWCIYFVRELACAQMRVDASFYDNFVDEGLQPYTERMLKFDEEIDHVGFSALSRIFLQPAGISLEILQLNRNSTNAALDCETFAPEKPAVDTIRALYRPGHYDLIYAADPAHKESGVKQEELSDVFLPFETAGGDRDMHTFKSNDHGLADNVKTEDNSQSSMPPTDQLCLSTVPDLVSDSGASDDETFFTAASPPSTVIGIFGFWDERNPWYYAAPPPVASANDHLLHIMSEWTPAPSTPSPARARRTSKAPKRIRASPIQSRTKFKATKQIPARRQPLPSQANYYTEANPIHVSNHDFSPRNYTVSDFEEALGKGRMPGPPSSPIFRGSNPPRSLLFGQKGWYEQYDAVKESEINSLCPLDLQLDWSI